MSTNIPAAVLVGPLFEDLDLLDRKAFLESLPLRVVEDQTVLWREGESGATMYIVLDGVVRVVHREGDREIELDRAITGQTVGELSVISPAARTGTAIVTGWTRVLVLDRDAFRASLADRAPAAEALLRYATRKVCRRLRQVDARIALAHDARTGQDRGVLQRRIAEVEALGGLP